MFLQLCQEVQHNSAIQARVSSELNGHKNKTVRSSEILVADTDSESHAQASDIEDELEEEDKEEAEEVDDNNNHKLQQVVEDYQPGERLKEGTPIFILLSVQPKV